MDVYCCKCERGHEVTGNPWDALGSNTICPQGLTLEYDEQYDPETFEVSEYWYFEERE